MEVCTGYMNDTIILEQVLENKNNYFSYFSRNSIYYSNIIFITMTNIMIILKLCQKTRYFNCHSDICVVFFPLRNQKLLD